MSARVRNGWPGEQAARGLRQWPVLERLRARVEDSASLIGMLLVGSLAGGSADLVSDLDLLLVAPEGGFDAAWTRRHDLPGDQALVAWDELNPAIREAGAHLKAAVRKLQEAGMLPPASPTPDP